MPRKSAVEGTDRRKAGIFRDVGYFFIGIVQKVAGPVDPQQVDILAEPHAQFPAQESGNV